MRAPQGSDSFVTCSAAFELESYKYSVLAAASGEKQPAAAGPGSVGAVQAAKRIQTDWKLVLGEAAVDIRLGRITNAGSGESENLFCSPILGPIDRQQQSLCHEDPRRAVHALNMDVYGRCSMLNIAQ